MASEDISVPSRREPELAGQTVVVIGGSAGIGLETARRAKSEGALVILTGRNPDRLTADANDADALKDFFDGVPVPIDHMVVTAGGPRRRPCWR
jgi:NAD(P)-dependent dehydrogenase (short-subunit alcohol dehydrogenase family)